MKQKLLSILPWLAFALIVFGVRLAVCNHLATDAPLSDDWRVYDELERVHQGTVSPFGPHTLVPHGQHRILFTKIQEAVGIRINGVWQLRIENVMHAFAYMGFALISAWLLVRAAPRNRAWIYILALFLFTIPWAGGRTLWAFLSCFTWLMLITVLEVAVLVHVKRFWVGLGVSLLLCTGACMALGSGSLVPLLAVGWFFWRGVFTSEHKGREFLAAGLHLVLFVLIYISIPASPEELTKHDGLRTTLLPFLRGLGWPLVFAWPAGILAFAPWFFLGFKWLKSPKTASNSESLLFLLGGVVALQCAGIAIFRGENNNGGVPGNRYYDLMILGPIVNAAILCLPGLWTKPFLKICSFKWLKISWVMLTVAGMGANLFWRVIPWVTKQNGEWDQGIKQALMASYARGEISSLPQAVAAAEEDPYDLGYDSEFIAKRIDRSGNQKSMLPASVVGGFPLSPEPGSEGFVSGGFPANSSSQPFLKYWGTFAKSSTPDARRDFVSQSFRCELPYLYFDLVLDKKARLRNYRLPERSLVVERLSDGVVVQTIDVLDRLKFSFPSVLRDRESVCVPIPVPGEYRVRASDHQTGHAWFAFSEPLAYGGLAAVCHDILNSGKLFLLMGGVILFGSVAMGVKPFQGREESSK